MSDKSFIETHLRDHHTSQLSGQLVKFLYNYEEVLVGAAKQQSLQLKENVSYQAPNPMAIAIESN